MLGSTACVFVNHDGWMQPCKFYVQRQVCQVDRRSFEAPLIYAVQKNGLESLMHALGQTIISTQYMSVLQCKP